MKRWLFDTVLGRLALLTFAATRLIGLDQFGQLFPTTFQNGPSRSLSTSVYAQVMPYLLVGKSIFVIRAVPALVAVTGAIKGCCSSSTVH